MCFLLKKNVHISLILTKFILKHLSKLFLGGIFLASSSLYVKLVTIIFFCCRTRRL